MEASATLRSDSLEAWIAASRVCWELAPATEVRGGLRVHEGFQLTLLARDPRGLAGHPADPERVRAWNRLRDLALRALPADSGWRLREEPFDNSWRLRRGGDWEPEVQFSAVLEPLDTNERGHAERALPGELRQRFEKLGVPEAR